MTKSQLTIIERPIESLRPYARNARTHSKKQIKQIAASIDRFGFNNPVLISDDDEIIAGHGRVTAAKQLGLQAVPTVRLSHLSDAERRAYVLADNKHALNAGYDPEILAIELQFLLDENFDLDAVGFSMAETDFILDDARESAFDAKIDRQDEIPPMRATPVTRPGDLFQLNGHKVFCGDARNAKSYECLLGDETVDLIITDPPYNVPIDGHVSGLGRIKHRAFPMANGEMSRPEFTEFLTDSLSPAAHRCRDGAIAFVFMDWRHLLEVQTAGEAVFSELKAVCVWNKTNGGMGTFYRSKHELIFVFKVGTAPHVNNFGLGSVEI